MSSDSPVDPHAERLAVARAELDQLRDDQLAWQQELQEAVERLVTSEAAVGARALDDRDGAAQIVRDLVEQRAQVDVAEEALKALEPRIRDAERAWLIADADRLEPEVTAARERLAAHEARTGELLAELQAHEGAFVPHVELVELRLEIARTTGSHTPTTTVQQPVSRRLLAQVRAAERPVLIRRELAAGGDPRPPASFAGNVSLDEFYGDLWGPDAVVAVPAWVEHQAAADLAVVKQERADAARERAWADAEPIHRAQVAQAARAESGQLASTVVTSPSGVDSPRPRPGVTRLGD